MVNIAGKIVEDQSDLNLNEVLVEAICSESFERVKIEEMFISRNANCCQNGSGPMTERKPHK